MSMITPITIEGFPQNTRPWSNIQPFTYRDGLTYLEVLEALRHYVRDFLVPAMNDEMQEVGEAWNVEIVALIAAVEQAVNANSDNVNEALSDNLDTVNTALAQNVADVAALVTTINNAIAAIPVPGESPFNRIDNPYGFLTLDNDGGLQHSVGGTVVFKVDKFGKIVLGDVPFARVSGDVPTTRVATQELLLENLDDIRAPGTYFQVSNANATTDRNYPVQNMSGSLINLPVIPSIGRATQLFVLNHNVGAGIYTRSAHGTGYSAWSIYMTQASSDGRYYRKTEVDTAIAVVGNTIPADSSEHEYRVAQMSARRGTVTYSSPAVVVPIFDHGFTKAKSILIPLLNARNIPATFAVNAGLMGDATNNGATSADLKAWAEGGRFEMANHGRMHVFSGSLSDEIRGGREDVEAIIGMPVDTYIQAGVTNDTWGALYTEVAGTNRGRIAMSSHAAVTGVMPSSTLLYPIGQPTPGAKGTWIDNGGATITTMKNKIGEAVNAKAMTIIRMHPEHIDGSGRITTAELTAFLDWLVAERDAGRITIMQYRDAGIARRVLPASGLRDVSTLFGLTGGKAYLQVTSGIATLTLINAAKPGAGTVEYTATGLLPVTMQSPMDDASALVIAGTATPRRLGVNRNGQARLINAVEGDVINGSISWHMTRVAPAIWPGIAA